MSSNTRLAARSTGLIYHTPRVRPYQVTVADAAAPDKALAFLFWGGVFVLAPVPWRNKGAGPQARLSPAHRRLFPVILAGISDK
jgi:hypothetical protein